MFVWLAPQMVISLQFYLTILYRDFSQSQLLISLWQSLNFVLRLSADYEFKTE